MQDCPEIILTGGPCAGKTTALTYLFEKLGDRGVRLFRVPEVATMLIMGGISDIGHIAQIDPKTFFEIERSMYTMQFALREQFQRLAQSFSKDKRLIIYDRGPMDVSAYISPEMFQAIMSETKTNYFDARDSFDAVIHMVTAANGAENFYTTANNQARRETAEEARTLDDKTLQAWVGHSRLRIVGNDASFEQKLFEVLQFVSSMLEMAIPVYERKFRLESVPDLNSDILRNARRIDIEQIYLTSKDPDQELRIRKRSQDGSATYYLTQKTSSPGLLRREIQRFITPSEYLQLKATQDSRMRVVNKTRYCFTYKNQYFELDLIPGTGLILPILEVELTEKNSSLELPPFARSAKEVTDDLQFTNHSLAQI